MGTGRVARAGMGLLVIAATFEVLAEDPYTLVESGAHHYTLQEPVVYWHTAARCIPTPDHGPPIGAEDPELIRRVYSAGGNSRTLFEENPPRDPDECNPYEFRSNLIADAESLYWVDSRNLVRLSKDANPGDAPSRMGSASWAGTHPVELARDSDFLYGRTYDGVQSRVWKISKTGRDEPELLKTVVGFTSDLSADGKYIYWRRSGTLYRTGLTARSSLTSIASGVTAFYAEGRRSGIGPFPATENVFVARGSDIVVYNNVNGNTTGPIYESSDGDAIIDSVTGTYSGPLIVRSAYVFFTERREFVHPEPPHFTHYNQYVIRIKRGGSAGDILYVKQGSDPGEYDVDHVSTNGDFVFWQDGEKVLRLPVDASAIEKVNFRATGLEVTQGIQDLANSVDLIQNRRTFVRLYGKVNVESPPVAGVSATLSGSTRLEGHLGTLWPVNSIGTRITLHSEPDRADINQSFLFELPLSWTTKDGLRLVGIINPNQVPLETAYGDNGWEVGPLSFKPSPRFEPNVYIFAYDLSGQTFIPRYQEDVLATYSWLRRVYPLASAPGFANDPTPGLRPKERVVYDSQLGQCVARTHPVCGAWLPADRLSLCASQYAKFLMGLWALQSGDILKVHLALMVGQPNPIFVRGSTTGHFSTSPTGSGNWGWDFDGTYADWYAGHEIGHALGRGHPNERADDTSTKNVAEGCGHDPGDPYYPYKDAYIGAHTGIAATLEGFDVGALNCPRRPLPRDQWTDFMSYCDFLWTSDYTYNALYDAMAYLDPGLQPLVPAQEGPVGGGAQEGDWLAVLGLLREGSDEAVLVHTRRLSSAGMPPGLGEGRHSIQLVGSGGIILEEMPFLPLVDQDTPEGLQSFMVVLPFSAGGKQIRVVRLQDDRVMESVEISEHPPAITSLSLETGGQPVSGDVTLSWTASDPDGDSLTFDVLYAQSGSESFLPLHTSLVGDHARIDTRFIGGGPTVLRLVAFDGVHTAERETGSFQVALKPPEPRILYPPDGTRVQYGQLVSFFGEARDWQTGGVASRSLFWSLNGDAMGRGPQLSTDDLPVGTQTVRLTATNAAGLSGHAEVTVIVHDDALIPSATLSVAPDQVGWHVEEGTAALQTATVRVSNCGSGILRWTASESADWLSLSETSGSGPGEIVLSGDPKRVGTSESVSAEVTLTNQDDPDDRLTVHVSLSVGCVGNCDATGAPGGVRFRRGDSTGEGLVDISDSIAIFNYLFLGGATPGCLRAADANVSGAVDISDGIYLLNFLFLGGPEPGDPFPDCGEEPFSVGLPCVTQPGCR